MMQEWTRQKITQGIENVKKTNSANFTTLIKYSSLDPKRDLKYQDWSYCDFTGCDLRGYDFTGARLWGCNFTNALIEGAIFNQAEIGYAPPLPIDFLNKNKKILWSFWEERGELLCSHDAILTKAKDHEVYVRQWQQSSHVPTSSHIPIGAVFQDTPFGPEMCVIPSGTFMMGSPDLEKNRQKNEILHEVILTDTFAISRYPITFEQWSFSQYDKNWEKITHIPPKIPDDFGWGYKRRPVLKISWIAAKAYAKWLSIITGQSYDLPTEAQWEYAARAGSNTAFWWGNSITTKQANYNGEYPYENEKKESCLKRTLRIQNFQPNPFGLYQVHGNVWEWCDDSYESYNKHKKYNPKPSIIKNKTLEEQNLEYNTIATLKNIKYIARGGSWLNCARSLRSAHRSQFFINDSFNNVGFRLMRKIS